MATGDLVAGHIRGRLEVGRRGRADRRGGGRGSGRRRDDPARAGAGARRHRDGLRAPDLASVSALKPPFLGAFAALHIRTRRQRPRLALSPR